MILIQIIQSSTKYLSCGIKKKKNLEKVETKYYDGPALIETKKWSHKEPLIHLEASFEQFPTKKLAMIFFFFLNA